MKLLKTVGLAGRRLAGCRHRSGACVDPRSGSGRPDPERASGRLNSA